jgi:hypothetical protein
VHGSNSSPTFDYYNLKQKNSNDLKNLNKFSLKLAEINGSPE